MRTVQIKDPKRNNATFSITEAGNIEFANPIDNLAKQIYHSSRRFDLDIFNLKREEIMKMAVGVNNPEAIIERVITKNALKLWKEMLEKILSRKLPKNLVNILECNNKKEQFKILNGLKLNRDQLILLSFKAWEDYNFTYSTYRFEHLPKGIDRTQMPKLVYKEEDGQIIIIGNTTLTSGQLKQIIEQRRVLIAKFLEREDKWHCFFYTYKSINGHEAGALRHMHYVSNAWNFTREEALLKLKEKYYPFSSVPHIEYIEDGD